jgi:4-hydroxyphenylpyruvate dioxygenase
MTIETAEERLYDGQERPIMEEGDFLKINDVDHIELYVGNAYQAAYFYQHAFGFKPVAYSGLESGERDRVSHVLQQGKVRLVLTGTYRPDSEIAAHQLSHGDGVKVLAFTVDDVEKAYHETTARGARGVQPPTTMRDDHGVLRTAAIATYGDTIHRFVERGDYSGAFMPGYMPVESDVEVEGIGAMYVDHCVGNVELGKMNHWVGWYHRVMGFRQLMHFDDDDISTEYSALMSKVMQNGTGRIKMPINEPADGKRKSQIEEYLEYYRGAGVQHIAIGVRDIIAAVAHLRERGVRFLRVPDTYYEILPERVGQIEEDMATIAELGILVDRDDEGYLLQIFTQPLQDRPTMFIELIERHGSRGFGIGNFKALFESIELEQARRGNL